MYHISHASIPPFLEGSVANHLQMVREVSAVPCTGVLIFRTYQNRRERTACGSFHSYALRAAESPSSATNV